METVRCSETSMNITRIVLCHSLQDGDLLSHRCENLKPHTRPIFGKRNWRTLTLSIRVEVGILDFDIRHASRKQCAVLKRYISLLLHSCPSWGYLASGEFLWYNWKGRRDIVGGKGCSKRQYIWREQRNNFFLPVWTFSSRAFSSFQRN
jgi:hypothetical protein